MFQRVTTLPVAAVTMPPDMKKQCNGTTAPPTAPVLVSVPPPPSPPETKRSAKDYIFGKTIGEGSFSTVYLAKDIHNQRDFASEYGLTIETSMCPVYLEASHFGECLDADGGKLIEKMVRGKNSIDLAPNFQTLLVVE